MPEENVEVVRRTLENFEPNVDDDLAQETDPVFWRWFHYEGRFESEAAAPPTSTTSATTES